MRLTNLDFDGIVSELENPDAYFPKLFLLGEMGNLLMEGGPEAIKAEKFFRDMLDSDESEEYKKIAIRHLLALDHMEKETWEKLKNFPKESYDNRKIYQEAGESEIIIRAGGV